MTGSRLPGFYKLSVDDRRALVAERSGVSLAALCSALESGGIDAATADKLVENVLGTYAHDELEAGALGSPSEFALHRRRDIAF